MDIANLPAKIFTFSGRESEPTTMARRPFSPISSAASSRENADFSDDQNILSNNNIQRPFPKNDETTQKNVSAENALLSTPTKNIPAVDEGNHTPNMKAIPPPATPMTVSAPMQTTITPAPVKSLFSENLEEGKAEETEYSFEELRAGFVLSNTNLRRAIHV